MELICLLETSAPVVSVAHVLRGQFNIHFIDYFPAVLFVSCKKKKRKEKKDPRELNLKHQGGVILKIYAASEY